MANLWWPSDRTWCVASEIDLQWTYVGGSAELIDRVLLDDRMETLSAAPGDLAALEIDGWLGDLIERATLELLAGGSVRLSLALGSVEVAWQKSGRLGQRSLASTTTGINGTSSGNSPVRTRDEDYLRRQIHGEVRRAVLSLVSV